MAAFPDIQSSYFLRVYSSGIEEEANKYDSLLRCGAESAGDLRTLGGVFPADIGYAVQVDTYVTLAGSAISEGVEFSGTGVLSYYSTSGYWYNVSCTYRFDGTGKIAIGFIRSDRDRFLSGPPLPD